MFQYAAARLAAERLSCRLIIEEPLFRSTSVSQLVRGSSSYSLYKLFPKLRDGRFGLAVSLCRRIFPNAVESWVSHVARTTFTPRTSEFGTIDANEAFDPSYFEIKAGTHLSGYFQSSKYFAGEESRVREWYAIDSALAEEAASQFRRANLDPLSTVAVHVRLGDYRTQRNAVGHPEEGWLISRDYYSRAFSRLPKGLAFAVFSDEPGCAEDFIGRKADFLGGGLGQNVDFAMMSQCRFIVAANSTFSWWAAWLAEASNPLIIAPKYFLGWRRSEWFPADIMVPRWEYI